MLYHYTTFSGFLGIIQSSCLHSTHVNFLNDSSEGSYFWRYIDDRIEESAANQVSNFWKNNQINTPELMRIVNESPQQNKLVSAIKTAARMVVKEDAFVRYPVFVASFCRHHDQNEIENGLLSQWRGYGGAGGIAIGFNEEQLSAQLESERSNFDYIVQLSKDVTYAASIDENFKAADLFVNDIITSVSKKDRAGGIYSVLSYKEMMGTLGVKAFLTKNPSFSEEREYRIVSCISNINPDNSRNPLNKTIHYRESNGIIRPFIKLFEKIDGPLPISEVLIGPGVNQDRIHEAIKLLFSEKYRNIEIRKSKIPFV